MIVILVRTINCFSPQVLLLFPNVLNLYTGYRFYVLFVEKFTKYSCLFPLKLKFDVYSTFVAFKSYVENIPSNKIKTLRSNLGGEFTSCL